MNKFSLTLSSPDGELFQGEAYRLSVRGIEGDLAVMKDHIPFITVTKAGNVKINTGDEELSFEASEGILTVSEEMCSLVCSNVKRL